MNGDTQKKKIVVMGLSSHDLQKKLDPLGEPPKVL